MRSMQHLSRLSWMIVRIATHDISMQHPNKALKEWAKTGNMAPLASVSFLPWKRDCFKGVLRLPEDGVTELKNPSLHAHFRKVNTVFQNCVTIKCDE